MAPHFPLARGWLRQLESGDFDLFTGGQPDARARTGRWLHDRGVSYVALADADPDYLAEDEDDLIRGGLPYLRPVWSNDTGASTAVRGRRWPASSRGPSGRARGAGDRLATVGAAELRRSRPGTPGRSSSASTTRRYWTVTAGDACVERDGDWTRLDVHAAAGSSTSPPGSASAGSCGRDSRMLGIALALASSVAWGTSDFLGGLQSRRISALTVLLVSQPVGLVLALGVALAVGGDSLSARDAAIAAGAGAAVVMALGAFYRAMALGSVTVVATIGALGVLVPVAAGLVQGDRPGAASGRRRGGRDRGRRARRARAGSRVARGRARSRSGSRPWRRSASAPSSWGSTSPPAPGPAWTIVAARTAGVATLLVAAAFARPSMRIEPSLLPSLLAIGFFDVLANSLFAVATNHGLLSLVAVAGSLYSAVTVLLARFVLGERLARSERAGVVVALAGVALIAGRRLAAGAQRVRQRRPRSRELLDPRDRSPRARDGGSRSCPRPRRPRSSRAGRRRRRSSPAARPSRSAASR